MDINMEIELANDLIDMTEHVLNLSEENEKLKQLLIEARDMHVPGNRLAWLKAVKEILGEEI